LGGKAVAGTVTDLGRIGVASDLPAARGDEERPAGRPHRLDLCAEELRWWGHVVEGGGAVENMVSVDCRDRLGIVSCRIAKGMHRGFSSHRVPGAGKVKTSLPVQRQTG